MGILMIISGKGRYFVVYLESFIFYNLGFIRRV